MFFFSALSSGYDGDAAEKGGSKADLYDRRRPGYDMAVIEELRGSCRDSAGYPSLGVANSNRVARMCWMKQGQTWRILVDQDCSMSGFRVFHQQQDRWDGRHL